jgi:hypothetical protein
VAGEDPLLLTNDEGDDSRGSGASQPGTYQHPNGQRGKDLEEAYPRVASEAEALETVPARRRPRSTDRLVMPASLEKEELDLLCLPDDDLEKLLLLFGGCSKRRENILTDDCR